MGPEQIERAVELRRAVAQAGGLAVVERFIGTQRGLTRAERDLVLDWADNSVRGIFELRPSASEPARPSGQAGSVTALNLVDDLDYVVYGLDPRPAGGGFFAGTLLPLARDDSAWLAAGGETVYPANDGRQVARLAIDMATREPDLVFRNAEKAEQGWMYMRRDREEFVAFFGTDELVLPILEAEGRLNAYYKVRRDPALAEDREHANVLRAYLREDTIPPLPLRRMAATFPDNVDPVFRRVLGNRNFQWTSNGPGLLRKRKPGYYEAEPTPGVAVLSDRVMALSRGER